MSSSKVAFPPLARSLCAAAAALSMNACSPIAAQDRGSGAGRPSAGPSPSEAAVNVGAIAPPAPEALDKQGSAPPPNAESPRSGGSARAVVVELPAGG